MIKYKELRWGNVFSYGPNNKINFEASPLTQLVGKNGHGKSSIGLILEEVQFNTNSKGIKKAKVINRYSKEKSYWIELDFDKDGKAYTISTKRTVTSGTVSLVCEGVDISGHTATSTYKSIEEILGYNHKTFAQLVYQGSVSSLEFLTATDTARKKFLIDLLNLGHYSKASDVFKKLASDTNKALDIATAKVNTVTSWINKYKNESLEYSIFVDEPDSPSELTGKLGGLEIALKNIDANNTRIIQNNKYKELLDAIVLEPFEGPAPDRTEYNKKSLEIRDMEKKLAEGKSLTAKGECLTTKCPHCSQDMDNSLLFNMSKQFETKKSEYEQAISLGKTWIKNFENTEATYLRSQKKAVEYEKYYALYNPTLDNLTLDEKLVREEISSLKLEIASNTAAISKAKELNKLARDRNAKIDVIVKQMAEMRAELSEYTAEVTKLSLELSDYEVLVKAFSTTGLVAYKIECLVKDLESLTNEYLTALADGRFQISFQISSSDKLNVVITDNGNDIDIEALSTGEKARVNVASLLAIRKLMQSLSNSRTNLLILDETTSNLDTNGKEVLVEVLLAEESLNTIIVSHDFTHPLLEKISVIKVNNISSLEYL